MGHRAGVAGFLYSQVICVAIASLIGAVFLPAMCAAYNKMARRRRSPTGVPEPSMAKAMAIMFLVALINAVLVFFLTLVVAAVGGAAGARQQNTTLVAQLVSLPVTLLVMAGMLSGMLPTTFGRAFLVTLLYLLVVAFVMGVVVGITVLIMNLLGANRYFRGWEWPG